MSIELNGAVGGEKSISSVMRRYELLGKRLALPINLLPGEGLADVVFRAAAENGYLTASAIKAIIGVAPGRQLSHLALSKEKIDPQLIADALGVPTLEEIQRLLYDRRSDLRRISFFGRDLHRSNLRSSRTVSPRALKAYPYQKAIWGVHALRFDPSNYENLLLKCPVCEKPLGWNKTVGVACCAACHEKGRRVDLRDFPQEINLIGDEEGLRFVIDLINPEVSLRDSLLPDELRRFGPGKVFELAVGLASLADYPVRSRAATKGFGVKHLNPAPERLAEAGRALLNGRSGLCEFSRGIVSAYSAKFPEYMSEQKHPFQLFDQTIDPLLKQMIVDLACYGSRSGHDVGRRRRDIQGSAAREVQNEKIVPLSQTERTQKTCFLTQAGDTELHIAKQEREIARATGIPAFYLFSTEGRFPRSSHEALFAGMMTSSADELVRLVTEYRSVRKSGPPPKGTISVAKACAAISSPDRNAWPHILTALLQEELRFWTSDCKRGPIMDCVLIRDFDVVAKLIRSSHKQLHLTQYTPSPSDVARLLGTSDDTVYLLRKQGALRRRGTLGEVWSMLEHSILLSEVQHRLAMKGHHLSLGAITSELKAAGVNSFLHGGRARTSLRERAAVEAYFGDRLFSRP